MLTVIDWLTTGPGMMVAGLLTNATAAIAQNKLTIKTKVDFFAIEVEKVILRGLILIEVKFLAKTAALLDGNFTVFRVKNAEGVIFIVEEGSFISVFFLKIV